MFVLYRLTFENGKVYIGITSDLERRLRQHKSSASTGSVYPVHAAIRKYGFDTVKIEMLCIGDRDYILDLEIRAIAAFKTQNRRYGYNLAFGGNASPMTSETREKLSKNCRAAALKRWIDPVIRDRLIAANRNREFTDAGAEQLAAARKNINYALPERAEKIRQAALRRWAKPGAKESVVISEKQRAALTEGRKKRHL